MRHDLFAAARALRAARGLSITAVTVLALGIGVGAAMFSVVDAVLVRPLPFPTSEELVATGVCARSSALEPVSAVFVGGAVMISTAVRPGPVVADHFQ